MSDQMPEKPPRGPTPPPQPPNRMGRSLMAWAIGIGLVIMAFMMLSKGVMGPGAKPIPANQFWTDLDNGAFTGQIVVKDRRIEGTYSPDYQGLQKDETHKFY